MQDKTPARAKADAFNWEDPFLLEDQLTEDERAVRDTAHAYAQEKLAPRVIEAYLEEKTDRAIFNEMGALGPARRHAPGEVRLRRHQLRVLRPDRPRDRARRLRLPLHE